MATHNANTSLFISGPVPHSGSINSYVRGATEEKTIPLVIINSFPTGVAPLFIRNDKFAQPSGSGDVVNNTADLNIVGARSTASGDVSLFITSTDRKFEASGTAPLFLQAPIGNLTSSGTITAFISGDVASADGIFFRKNNNINLHIRSNSIDNNNMPLYIENPYGSFNAEGNVNLFVRSNAVNNNVDLYTSGVFVQASGLDLIIKAPETKTLNIFTRGFSE